MEILEKRRKGLLRTGYTTGTSASAATKAGLLTLKSSQLYHTVDVVLPKGKTATLRIAWTKINQPHQSVTCAVIKDGGDDPDVTHGAEICSTVSLTNKKGLIEIDGGIGVGRVTRPGLGLEIGTAAINPIPKRMIEHNLFDSANSLLSTNGIKIIISEEKRE